ncbi:MAG TPA: transporter [Ruminococcaceae bacterium]|nr:transporter [Oscillospiraceae bacterium]
MLNDITIGQFFPGNSVIHRMDSRFKIVLDIIYVVMLFVAQNFYGLGIACIFMVMVYAASGISFRLILKSIKPVLAIIIFTALLNLLFVKGDDAPLIDTGFITIYAKGVETSIFMIVRIIFLIIGMSLLTYTTSPIVLTDAIESLLSPLKKVHFPVHELAMMMTIALRFIPTLIEELNKIMMAQKARGAALDTGNVFSRAKAMVPILIPLFISAFKRANELATAMECRCYKGGEGRTKLRQLKATRLDLYASGVTLCTLGFVIIDNIVF